jgi:hypothetical protein
VLFTFEVSGDVIFWVGYYLGVDGEEKGADIIELIYEFEIKSKMMD